MAHDDGLGELNKVENRETAELRTSSWFWGRITVASVATNSKKRDMGADLIDGWANRSFRRGRPSSGIRWSPALVPCRKHEAEAQGNHMPGRE